MKTVDEIRKLTDKAVKDKAEKKRIAEIKAKQNEKKEREEMIKRAKDVSFFVEEIEEAAKKGLNEYSISLGKNDGSEYEKLHMKYIKEYLKDFNPQFTEKQEEGCRHTYDGDTIDGSEYYYTATYVHFNW